jgi:hypothetical protein
MEEYRTIKDCEDYAVSNFGNVKNIRTNRLVTQYNCRGYKKVSLPNDNYSIHQLVASAFLNNPMNKPYIYHINDDISDNRVENLRFVMAKEKSFNSIVYKSNTSGVKGIHWDKRTRSWQVRVTVGNKRIFLGRFKDLDYAIEVRRKKTIELFGEHDDKLSNDSSKND